jgi:predicted DNA-binding transcriptional regulator AlpA
MVPLQFSWEPPPNRGKLSTMMIPSRPDEVDPHRATFPTGPGPRLYPVAPEELASLKEVAEICGVAKRTAARYVDRDDFPPPLGTLGVGRVWRRRDVERWAKRMLPLPTGRPAK